MLRVSVPLPPQWPLSISRVAPPSTIMVSFVTTRARRKKLYLISVGSFKQSNGNNSMSEDVRETWRSFMGKVVARSVAFSLPILNNLGKLRPA